MLKSSRAAPIGRAFSLIDLLVSIAVVAVLISLLSPMLGHVREMTRRVVCMSNVRQMGFAIAMYSDDWGDWLPPSVFVDGTEAFPPSPEKMITIRLGTATSSALTAWDGLGILYVRDYLPEPLIYYCPSHTGNHPFEVYQQRWLNEPGAIRANYHYRGEGPNGAKLLSQIKPGHASLVADGMATQLDYNHKVGSNVLRANLSVFWFDDPGGNLAAALPAGPGDTVDPAQAIRNAWKSLDEGSEGG